ncbi:hypothetical protein ACHAXT_007230 [Thalassiosira profunda]
MPPLPRSALLGLAALAGAARAAHEPPSINDDTFAVTTKSSGKANTLHVLDNDEPAHDGDELKIMRLFTDESDSIPARKLEDYSALPDDLAENEHEIAYMKPSAPSKKGGLCEADGKGLRVKYYPPDLTFEGDDSCGYEACDDDDQCGTAMIYLTVTSPMTPSPTTASPTRMPVEAPEINDDKYDEAVGITNFAVLDNDVVAPSREPLKVMNIIPPHDGWEMIPGTERRRQRRLGETAGYVSASNGWENVRVSEGLEEDTSDEPEIAMVHAGAPSYAGGSCNPTGNRQRVKYYPPAGYVGADMCEYEACDDNGKGVCGRAMIYIAHAVSEETKSPTPSPTRKGSKARKQRSSKGSKEDKTSGGHHKKKKMKREKAREEKMKEEGDEDGAKETQRTKKLKKKRGEAEDEA